MADSHYPLPSKIKINQFMAGFDCVGWQFLYIPWRKARELNIEDLASILSGFTAVVSNQIHISIGWDAFKK